MKRLLILALALFATGALAQNMIRGQVAPGSGTTAAVVVPVKIDSAGGLFQAGNVFKNVSAVVITSESTVWTPASGKKFRLMGYCLAQGVATGAVTIKDNTAGSTILLIPQNTLGAAVCGTLGSGILSAAANNVLTATGASTETITGYFYGTEE